MTDSTAVLSETNEAKLFRYTSKKRGERQFRVWFKEGNYTVVYAKNRDAAYAKLTIEDKMAANNIVEFC